MRGGFVALAAAALLGLAAPAAAQEPGGWLDGFNRTMFRVNEALFDGMEAAGRALPEGTELPAWLKDGAGNLLANTINEPITALSHALAGRFDHAGVSLRRFGTNVIEGRLGTRDVATAKGLVVPRTDIGLALCKRGVAAGPYVVLPIVGPRTLRDGLSDVVLTNAVIYAALMPVIGPRPSLGTIALIEVLDEGAALAVARQIDSADEHGDDFETVRDRYLASRAQRCAEP